ncbi:MAG: glutathione S-transferase family protein [Hyphomicrobiales bacterium]|nr:glutathione S-transferase family protein [Hyphomicrobiales bacterium]
MLSLVHAPRSRSTRFIFLLEELGVPYEIKFVGIRRHDGSGAVDPTNPHPHGKAPALIHDGVVVFESPAIALYLTDTFPAAGLGPRVGEATRGSYLSLLSYYGSVLEPAVMSKFLNTPVPRGTAGWAPVEEVLAYLESLLAKGPFLLGEAFSAVDILYGTTFAMFKDAPFMPKSPGIADYAARVVARPAFARARERDAG